MEWTQLREEVALAASRFADLLRDSPNGDVRVPPTQWSVREVGAHLVSVPSRYRRVMEKPEPFPDSLPAQNEAEIKAVGPTAPKGLADRLEEETSELLDLLGDDGERPVPFFGMTHTAAGVGGLMLAELLIHGLDLAHVLGRPWPIRPDQAVAAASGVLPVAAYFTNHQSADFVNHQVAQRAADTYRLQLRGSVAWTIEVHDGVVSIERGRPPRADLHVSAEPVAFLLRSYGRVSQARVLLTGRIVGWGRKPWLAMPFSRLFEAS